LKTYLYVSILISLIFLVMGILILGNFFGTDSIFLKDDLVKYLFGGLLIVYGLFRGINGYLKVSRKNKDDDDRFIN